MNSQEYTISLSKDGQTPYFQRHRIRVIKPEDIYLQTEKSLSALLTSDLPVDEKLERTYLLCTYFFNVITEVEGLHFTTLFARMSYVITKFGLSSVLGRTLHQFRILCERRRSSHGAELPITEEEIFFNGIFAIAHTLSLHSGHPVPADIAGELPAHIPVLITQSEGEVKYERTVRFIGTSVDETGNELLGYVENSGISRRLNFNDPGRSDLYRENIIQAIDLLGLPIILSLVDVEITRDGIMSPRMIIVEPDYLMDVTSIAECFQSTGADARLHVVRKFIPRSWSAPLLLGGIANFFLDELVHNPRARYSDLVSSIFKLFPLEISQMPDDDLRALLRKAESHFRTLKRVVSGDLRALRIEPRNAFIEPSFYSPTYGLQGRLDLYHTKPDNESEIIELKSGSPYRKNVHGLSSTHYTQTLLYDLMVRSASNFTQKPASYILYSSQDQEPLRFAPVVTSIQREAIRLRNDVFLSERRLVFDPGFLQQLGPTAFPEISGFMSRDIIRFATALHNADSLERKYFGAFLKLVGEEQYYAKVGDSASDRSMGVAAIWLDSVETKNDRFAILHDLSVITQELSEASDLISLRRGGMTNPLANIRRGDIAVLYPDPTDSGNGAESAQVYKCSVVEINNEQLTVRLRNKQVNLSEFRNRRSWIVEPDILDSGFRTMSESLFKFLEAPEVKRRKFLGLEPPGKPDRTADWALDGSGPQIDLLLKRIIEAKDYFLLWGPPGTGKTSVVLRRLAEHYLNNTTEVILLMAYTNRAVDEMCAALDSLGGDIRDRYVRIGSRISTGDDYRSTLLSVQLDDISTRSELGKLLGRQRIIVSTVSSILGKPEIFRIMRPGIAIVDEASQILEPMLASVLTEFKKFILIGDHKQLPAVVVQPEEQTEITDEELLTIGLTNTRTSYFERLFKLAQVRNWDWCHGALRYQGRMHVEIMRFPCENFYDGQLEALPGVMIGRDLTGPLKFDFSDDDSVSEVLSSQRMIYMPAKEDASSPWLKANVHEAGIVADILERFTRLEEKPTIGVITPFRAQIAQIRNVLAERGMNPDDFTVDTVERYQGTARDVIILSTAVNDPVQLRNMISMCDDGVDRKLNVVLTRAREQFIVVGVEAVLRTDALYASLLTNCNYVSPSTADSIEFSQDFK